MTEIPGLAADIHFGGVNDELPDWRDETSDTDDPEDADAPDDHAETLRALGYDPSWWEEQEADADGKKGENP